MNLRNATNYNIGLDIGTASVGWAVTDEDGNLYHFKGKPTWGSRLFPTADTAAEARVNRGQRRRYDRRRQRLNLLQDLFKPAMQEMDPEFFMRLNQARLLPEDRAEGHADYRWPLFNGKDFNEKDYYKKFPTIYHLRAWLMETDEKADIRLIYLAFHNIVKTRGNFLYQDNPKLSAKNASMNASLQRLCLALEDWCIQHDVPYKADVEESPKELEAIFSDSSKNRSEQVQDAWSCFGVDKKRAQALAKAIVGQKANYSDVFALEGGAQSFYLTDDEKVEEFRGALEDDSVELFDAICEASSAYVLMGILKGASGKTISYCKMDEYERYGKDLRILKDLVKEYKPEEYEKFFRGPCYPAPYQHDYDVSKASGYTKYNLVRGEDYDGFRKEVEKLFAKSEAVEDPRYIDMTNRFKEQAFLRRLKTSDNGSIPYQLHLEEMRAIIENQGRHYPFLLEESGKIESLVSFRIPYYVGPLTQKNAAKDTLGNNRFAWSQRKPGAEQTKIYPWNWEDVIDKHKSAEAFINRMTGDCTYLLGEPVLPKCSLLYESFCVLNELNGARWTRDGDDWERFDADYRAGIYNDLFKHGTVTYKKVTDWLAQHGNSRAHVRGGQGETKFESKLASHIFFCKLLGVDDLDAETTKMAEEIILWNTLFEDRSILRDEVKRAYGNRLSDDQIAKICKKRFTGWGRLSNKLLRGLKAQTPSGPKSVMDILVEGNPNGYHVGSAMILMEILHDKNLGFDQLIEAHNKEHVSETLTVNDLPGSPAIRRSVNQSLRIVDEIASIAGKPPANIFIEVTRDEDTQRKGKRTTRRHDSIKAALESLKEEGAANPEVLKQFKNTKPEDLDKRLSLYFMQNGKCLYSGKPLDIRLISDRYYCQVDHIIPRSYIKDDSYENLALVLADENQRKADSLLLSDEIQVRMRRTWNELHEAKLIGDKKFNNLTRTRISDAQLKGFINRQIVETSQSIKFVRYLLESKYPETEICSVKASLSHQLRETCGLPKCREANNYHHAHDALIACEMGRFIQYRHPEAFSNPIVLTHVIRSFVKKQGEVYRKTRSMPGSAAFFVQSFLTSGFDEETGEVFKDTWNASAEVEKIKHFMGYKQCYISRMPIIDSGVFWDATIYSPRRTDKELKLPLKKGLDPKKYGSYSREQFAYFFVYKAAKKGKLQFVFAPVPVSVAREAAKEQSALEAYATNLASSEGMEFVEIARPRIPKYQLIELNGERFFITGKKEIRNGTELAFGFDEQLVLERISSGHECAQEELVNLFESMVSRLKAGSPKLAAAINIDSLADAFPTVLSADQKNAIINVASIASAQTNMINVSPLGGSKYAGCLRVTFSNLLTSKTDHFIFVDQSVTGMFERRQELEL